MRKWPRLHLQTKMTYPSPNASMYPAHSPKAQDTCGAAFPVKQLNPVKSRFITSELSVHEFHTSMEYCIELASSFESQFRALITWYSCDLLPVFPCLQNRLIKMRWVGRIFKRQVEARLEGGDEQLHINTEQNKEMNTPSIINIGPWIMCTQFPGKFYSCSCFPQFCHSCASLYTQCEIPVQLQSLKISTLTITWIWNICSSQKQK